MANKLNNHFTTIGSKLSAKIPDTGHEHLIEINDNSGAFEFDEIKYEEIQKVLGKLSPSKSCGIDGLTARLVKACGEAIIPPLLHIFNISVKHGIFPAT